MVLWHIPVMPLIMFWLVNWWLLNEWPNICYCSYCERESDLLDDFQISMRPLCPDMHLWPIDYLFTKCSTKWLSWLRPFWPCLWEKLVWTSLSRCHISFWKVLSSFGQWSGDKPSKGCTNSRVACSELINWCCDRYPVGSSMWWRAYSCMDAILCMQLVV